ncbi:PHP domain-containing protein [Candidatus Woesearchaeota archaeon]|nr:PHP domain-containing protein [Candidatus Woesearchaeota archaeon]
MNWRSVVFQKPQHSSILQEGYSAVDMHNHSEYSDTTTPITTIAKKARKQGIGLALTDHNEVAGNIKLAQDNPDLLVVPGLEITTKEMAHVLTYFYSRDELQDFFDTHIKDSRGGNPNLATKVSVTDLLDMTKNYNCVIAPAHPFAFPKRFSFISAMERGFVDKKVLKSLHGVEVICGANLRHMNHCAVDWANELGKATIGGSDAHTLGSLGSVVTVSEGSTVEEVLSAIKRKKTSVVGSEAKFYQRPLSVAKIASCHLRYFKPTMQTQYELSVKMPLRTTKKILQQKLGPEKRKEQRKGLARGIAALSSELEFRGYPAIQKPVLFQKFSKMMKKEL